MLAWGLAHFGALLQEEGEQSEAEEMFRKSLATGRLDDPGGFWETLPLNGLARSAALRRDFIAARDFARQAYEVSVKNLGPNHPASATSKMQWARYRSDSGETSAAVVPVLEAMPALLKGYAEPVINRLVALTWAAHVMNRAGHPPDAERYARMALAGIEAAHLPDADPRRAAALLELDTAQRAQARKP